MATQKGNVVINGDLCKHCHKCNKYKPVEQFNKGSCWDGYANKCKLCERATKRKLVTVAEKKCEICEETKPSIEFDLNKHTVDGLKYLCRTCDVGIQEGQKRCSACKQLLPLKQFAPNNGRGCGYSAQCYKCVYKAKGHKYDDYNKKYQATYREINAEELARKQAKHFQENKEQIYQQRLEYLQRNPAARIACNLRSRVHYALKSYQADVQKAAPTLELTGCTFARLASWLEFQFMPEMTWENYGKYWHVDHVIPCARYNLMNPLQQYACFNWCNLRPMEALANISKSDSVSRSDIFVQELKFVAYLRIINVKEDKRRDYLRKANFLRISVKRLKI